MICGALLFIVYISPKIIHPTPFLYFCRVPFFYPFNFRFLFIFRHSFTVSCLFSTFCFSYYYWNGWYFPRGTLSDKKLFLLVLMVSQLAGDEDMASRVRDILSMSVQPANRTTIYTLTWVYILVQKRSHPPFMKMIFSPLTKSRFSNPIASFLPLFFPILYLFCPFTSYFLFFVHFLHFSVTFSPFWFLLFILFLLMTTPYMSQGRFFSFHYIGPARIPSNHSLQVNMAPRKCAKFRVQEECQIKRNCSYAQYLYSQSEQDLLLKFWKNLRKNISLTSSKTKSRSLLIQNTYFIQLRGKKLWSNFLEGTWVTGQPGHRRPRSPWPRLRCARCSWSSSRSLCLRLNELYSDLWFYFTCVPTHRVGA